MLTHLSLFSGIGGIDLAAHEAGFTTVAFCERESYCQTILSKHWPDVPIFDDVREVTADALRAVGITRVDLLSGGFPCQPHSVAGKRLASADDRELWPEMHRVIREVRPRWVLGENTPGLFSSDVGRFFPGILRDLAALGYRVGWCCYGAGDVGAPHQRDRVFVVAYSNSSRQLQPSRHVEEQWRRVSDCGEELGNAIGSGFSGESRRGAGTELANGHTQPEAQEMADSNNEGLQGQLWPQARWQDSDRYTRRSGMESESGTTQSGLGGMLNGIPDWLHGGEVNSFQVDGKETNTTSPTESRGIHMPELRCNGEFGTSPPRLQQPRPLRDSVRSVSYNSGSESGLSTDQAPDTLQGVWKNIPSESQQEASNMQQGVSFRDRETECLETVVNPRWPARQGEKQYDWEPPQIAQGVKDRAARIKALGNAVVPAQIFPILRAIAEVERSKEECE
jgi:DNA-cytosine methyltransferase